MIREINVDKLTENISSMCIEANHILSEDMKCKLKEAVEKEESQLGKKF